MNRVCATCAKQDTCFYSSEKVIDCTHHEPKSETNYERLFGTPERAANTILALQICPMSKDECEEFCPAHDVCFEFYKDGRTVYEMVEWLRGDAE